MPRSLPYANHDRAAPYVTSSATPTVQARIATVRSTFIVSRLLRDPIRYRRRDVRCQGLPDAETRERRFIVVHVVQRAGHDAALLDILRDSVGIGNRLGQV